MERTLPRSRISKPLDSAELVRVVADLGPSVGDFLRSQRWFGSKGRTVETVAVVESADLPVGGGPCALVLVEANYTEGPAETYLVPLAAGRPEATKVLPERALLAEVSSPDGDWVLYDALEDITVCEALFRRVEKADRIHGRLGVFAFDRTPVLSQASGATHPTSVDVIRRLRAEQSNTSIVYDDRFVLKVFRRLSVGENPDLEASRFLTLKTRFRHIPPLAGFGQYVGPDGSATIALLNTFVPNLGDAWTWTLGSIRTFYAEARARGAPGTHGQAVAETRRIAESYEAHIRRLGEITGELHVALASDSADPAFAPEPVTPADLAAWADAIEAQVRHGLASLRMAAGRVTPGLEPVVSRVLRADSQTRAKIAQVTQLDRVPLWKIRTHGDYHLGQVLRLAGGTEGFVILDFEGEPARPLALRRAKQSPLRDVAGMLRSFTYASYAGLFAADGEALPGRSTLEPWRVAWETVVSDAFLDAYLAVTVGRAVPFVPASREVTDRLLSLFCLEKAAYELHYEVNNRPTWLPIPLAAFEREVGSS